MSGKAVTAGNQLYWKALNARGGVGGRYPVELEVADSEFFESVAVIEYDAMRERVVAFNQVFGTKPVIAILPRLRRDKILAVPAAVDGRWVYEPQLLPVASPPEIQAANAMAYWGKEGGTGPFCALRQDDTYGTAGFDGAQEASAELGIPIAASPTFVPLPGGFDDQLDQLQSAGCRAVLFIGLPYHAEPALTDTSRRGFDTRWILTSAAWSSNLAQRSDLAKYLSDNAWVIGDGPTWGDDSVPGMAALTKAHKRFAPDLAPGSEVVAGYLQSQALHQILEKASELGDLSRRGLVEAAGQIGRLRFDELSGDYEYNRRATDREPPRTSTIFAVDPDEPGGLVALRRDVTSPATAKIELPAPPR